jgi:hypothetical protein
MNRPALYESAGSQLTGRFSMNRLLLYESVGSRVFVYEPLLSLPLSGRFIPRLRPVHAAADAAADANVHWNEARTRAPAGKISCH